MMQKMKEIREKEKENKQKIKFNAAMQKLKEKKKQELLERSDTSGDEHQSYFKDSSDWSSSTNSKQNGELPTDDIALFSDELPNSSGWDSEDIPESETIDIPKKKGICFFHFY